MRYDNVIRYNIPQCQYPYLHLHHTLQLPNTLRLGPRFDTENQNTLQYNLMIFEQYKKYEVSIRSMTSRLIDSYTHSHSTLHSPVSQW